MKRIIPTDGAKLIILDTEALETTSSNYISTLIDYAYLIEEESVIKIGAEYKTLEKGDILLKLYSSGSDRNWVAVKSNEWRVFIEDRLNRSKKQDINEHEPCDSCCESEIVN